MSLRNTRRGRERLRLLIALLGGSLLVALVVASALDSRRADGPFSTETFSTRAALSAAARGPVLEATLCSIEEVSLRRGQAPSDAFREAGLDAGTALELLEGLSDEVPLRAIRPEDRFLLYRARDGAVTRLEFQRRPEERVVVEAAGSGFEARRETFPARVLVRHVSGSVESSLWEAVLAAGGGPEVVLDLSDVFGWDFDFTTDTRPGDRFSVLVEDRYIDGERVGFGRILAARLLPAGEDLPLEAFHWAGAGAHEGGYYDSEGRALERAFLKSPLNFRRISSHFSHSRMHPILKKPRPHLGIDYAAPSGTPVVALGNGKISFAGWIRGFGRTVKIKHNGVHLTQYAHLSRIARGIAPGTRVRQGQVIGYVGSTGLSTGPHLDFRVQENGRWINPLHLKGGRAEPLPDDHRGGFLARVGVLDGLFADLPAGTSRGLAACGLGADAELASARLDTPEGP